MTSNEQHVTEASVEEALKGYRRASKLEAHAAARWPIVQALQAQGPGTVVAIRQALDAMLDALAASDPSGAALLRERYVNGRPIEALAQARSIDVAHLHRIRRATIAELEVLIAEANRQAERRLRAERFRVRHVVHGVDALVESVVARLSDPGGPGVVVLEGMGGLGKTTVARLIAQRFLDGAHFTDVAWVTAKQTDFDVWGGRRRATEGAAVTPSEVLYGLAKELGIERVTDLGALQAEVRVRCLRQPRLIVIDNLETIADSQALAPLIALLVGPSRVLITTREHAPEVLPATVARWYISLDELDAPTSFALLRSAAADIGVPALVAAADEELARIYAVTGGNPLALWLVAGQAHGVPWAEFVRSLDASFRRDTAGFELFVYLYRRSWKLLGPDARAVLLAMHRFEQGASYELLATLTELGRAPFETALAELRRRSLLSFDGALYTIHRLTYAFLRVVLMGWWP